MQKKLIGAMLAMTLGSTAIAATADTPSGFRDLNKNGRMDVYEDRHAPVSARVEDLLHRMTLAEKVGTLLHGNLPGVGAPFGSSTEGYDFAGVDAALNERHVTSFISRLTMPPADLARMNNELQSRAERSRLGIPVTISSDPRNHFQAVEGASNAANGFSQWPEPIGLGAIGDPALVRQFGDTVRQEYRAVGFHMALSPQADLATEPRWSRTAGTFGSDPSKVSRLVEAYITGLQGPKTLDTSSVAAVVKHWVGYGAAPEGFDSHNYYGRHLRLSNKSFALHAKAFDGAFRAGVAGVMPTYGIAEGVSVGGAPLEPVGAGFNQRLLRDELRQKRRYNGLIITDWGIANDCARSCRMPTQISPQTVSEIAMPWGVEDISQEDRVARALNAGVDQFGGLDDPSSVLAAVRARKVATSQMDNSVRRVLALKFQLGLFENPYVDPDAANRIVGSAQFREVAEKAQRNAIVILERSSHWFSAGKLGRRVWLQGVDPAAAKRAGLTVVVRPEEAEFAIVRAATPGETLHPYFFFGSFQKEGRLDFRHGDPAFDAVIKAATHVPVVFAVDMDRPAVLTAVRPHTSLLLAVFGASDDALIDVVAGRARPVSTLPFNLPSSMSSVEAQDPAQPDDDRGPLFRKGQTEKVQNM